LSFLIRAMEAGDIDGVLELSRKSLDAPRWARGDYERVLVDTPAALLVRHGLVALSGSGAVGFAVVSWLREEPAAELEGLFVDNDFRQQGIGAALMRACMVWAANAGAGAVRLEVRASNDVALALYHGHGFSAVGVRPAYYSAPNEDALLLEAALPL
jgi:[ribosomal protein S18]-alanine N-acetyltransferase